jgi:hypothetical protein
MALAVGLAAAMPTASRAEYPDRPIRLLLPFPAGSRSRDFLIGAGQGCFDFEQIRFRGPDHHIIRRPVANI